MGRPGRRAGEGERRAGAGLDQGIETDQQRAAIDRDEAALPVPKAVRRSGRRSRTRAVRLDQDVPARPTEKASEAMIDKSVQFERAGLDADRAAVAEADRVRGDARRRVGVEAIGRGGKAQQVGLDGDGAGRAGGVATRRVAGSRPRRFPPRSIATSRASIDIAPPSCSFSVEAERREPTSRSVSAWMAMPPGAPAVAPNASVATRLPARMRTLPPAIDMSPPVSLETSDERERRGRRAGRQRGRKGRSRWRRCRRRSRRGRCRRRRAARSGRRFARRGSAG